MIKVELTHNFSLQELCKSFVAKREGINNTTTDKLIIQNLTQLAMFVLQPIRNKFGPLSPESCFRCNELNSLLGGADDSQHLFGEAADLDNIPGLSNYDLAKWIVENLVFDQLILEKHIVGDIHSGWVHVSYNSIGVNKRETLRYDTCNGQYSRNTYYNFLFY